jgi:hypothetical protein
MRRAAGFDPCGSDPAARPDYLNFGWNVAPLRAAISS